MLERHVPHDVLYRPKMGFAVPLRTWFKGPLRQRVRKIMTAGHLLETGLFDERYLTTLAEQHESGISDHSAAIWSLMMFDRSSALCTNGAPQLSARILWQGPPQYNSRPIVAESRSETPKS